MAQRDRSESTGHKVVRRARWLASKVDPGRAVTREVRGVRLTMPRSHWLADHTDAFPLYGQNVVRLAEALVPRRGPLRVVDVGATIGDTARQVLDRVDARVLCVEGDPQWLPWLRRNAVEEMEIVAGLLTASTDGSGHPGPSGGTAPSAASDDASVGALTVADLYADHPGFHGARLVRSVVHGDDVELVPALAQAWATSRPVLLFEYDEGLSRDAGHDAAALWPRLAALGYSAVAVWDHVGQAVGTTTVTALCRDASALASLGDEAPHWDVAVAHTGDPAGRLALATALDAR